MGWNSWNTFGAELNQDLIIETADAMISTGLLAAGYDYVVLDDFWEADERDSAGRLTHDTAKFPNGMKWLGDQLHARGFKFGIYSCAGTHTCGGKPSSFGYEEIDAITFAEWGVDYLKYDNCYVPNGVPSPVLYRRMGQALRAAGCPIVFAMCEWGENKPWEWGAFAGAHVWRTTGDIEDRWESIMELADRQIGLEKHSGPGRWNDPDMLVVGMYGKGNVAKGGCTDFEYRSHFIQWCLLASPLMIGCDVRSMNEATHAILTNPGAIAVDQDPLGRQAAFLGKRWDNYETWARPLADGSFAVGLFNRDPKNEGLVSVAWEAMSIHDKRRCRVTDIWTGEDLGEHIAQLSLKVGPRDVKLVKVTPIV